MKIEEEDKEGDGEREGEEGRDEADDDDDDDQKRTREKSKMREVYSSTTGAKVKVNDCHQHNSNQKDCCCPQSLNIDHRWTIIIFSRACHQSKHQQPMLSFPCHRLSSCRLTSSLLYHHLLNFSPLQQQTERELHLMTPDCHTVRNNCNTKAQCFV